MSKEIEKALKCLGDICICARLSALHNLKNEEIVKQALTQKSKKELAFDVIKKKGVDVGVLKTDIINEHKDIDCYNCGVYEEYQLTQEEFKLLKEVL